MSIPLNERVERWLREIGCTPVVIDDSQAQWHVRVDYPARTANTLHVLIPKGQADAVVIAMAADVSPEHRAGFDRLDDEQKTTFNWEFRQRLNNIDVEFAVDGVETGGECPRRFQVMRSRYEDGLTKDGFAFSVGAVYKTWLKGVWYIQKELDPSAPGPGGRFDFKRLGL